jgi:rare lipoprotein A
MAPSELGFGAASGWGTGFECGEVVLGFFDNKLREFTARSATVVRTFARICSFVGCALALANCGGSVSSKIDPKYGVAASPRVIEADETVPKGGGKYRVGNAYTVAGRTYNPQEDLNYRADGIASWYGKDFHGRKTANGEIYDMEGISAAHPTMPIPSYARVTNLTNKRSIIVRVNDRGPFHAGRVIDVSSRTAQLLGFHDNGVAQVRVEYVGQASLLGSDDFMLVATLRHGAPAPGPATFRVAAARAVASQQSVPPAGARAPSAVDTAGARPPAAPAASHSFDARFAPASGLPSLSAGFEPVPVNVARSQTVQDRALVSGRGLY